MNIFTFSGNLGQDAETRFTPDGKPVVTFSVASTAGYGDKQKTTWIRCNAWGERYQKIAGYLLKGKKVTVSGEFSQREWQDQQGVTKYSCEVRVNDIDLPPRSEQDGQGYAPTGGGQTAMGQANHQAAQNIAARQGQADDGFPAFADDDIPFSNYELKTWA